MARFRRLRRWWPGFALSLLITLVYMAWPGSWTFTVGPETTYVTEPVDAEGYVDYPAALNERLRAGVTPETNANVLIVRALGPKPEGVDLLPEYYKWLGIDPPPEQGEYLLSWDKYFQAHLKDLPPEEPEGWFDELFGAEPDAFPARKDSREEWNNRVDRAVKWPWKANHRPEIADWLKRNEKPLALMIEASRRPHYYNPLVSRNPTPQSARVLSSLLSTVQKCREVARALSCRAMLRVGAGDLDGAWQDLMACQRLGRLIGSKGTLIEGLVGIAIVHIAANAQLTLLSHSKASSEKVRAWLEELRKLPPLQPVADKMDLPERFMTLDALQSVASGGPQGLAALADAPAGKPSGNRFRDRLFTRSIDYDPAFRNANRMFDRLVAAGRQPDRQARKAEFAKIEADFKELKATVTGMSLWERASAGPAERGEMIGNILIGLMLPAFQKLHDAADRSEQLDRNLQVAFALAAYRADRGRYPAKLDELAPRYLPAVPGDLFSGGALIYRLEGDGYLLYSVGVNGVDEDGRWTDDDPKGDDLRVRMPVPEPREKPKANPDPGRRFVID